VAFRGRSLIVNNNNQTSSRHHSSGTSRPESHLTIRRSCSRSDPKRGPVRVCSARREGLRTRPGPGRPRADPVANKQASKQGSKCRGAHPRESSHSPRACRARSVIGVSLSTAASFRRLCSERGPLARESEAVAGPRGGGGAHFLLGAISPQKDQGQSWQASRGNKHLTASRR
jgi:hypothetical protein